MTPAQIKFLLHCHTSPGPYDGPEDTEFIKSLAREMADKDLIIPQDAGYNLTERGQAYIDFIISVSLPEAKTRWVFSGFENED